MTTVSKDGANISIGNIRFSTGLASVLGEGCCGTFVYKGKFGDRDVAVKRILLKCCIHADREVVLLQESDQHPNVIRYFCTKSDSHFRYIALELCEATLSEWIEGRFKCDIIDPVQVLREATAGLAHLHSIRIVHRDVKPANILISLSGGRVTTKISDFGLGKKISKDRISFSWWSGPLEILGWMPREVLKNLDTSSPAQTMVN